MSITLGTMGDVYIFVTIALRDGLPLVGFLIMAKLGVFLAIQINFVVVVRRFVAELKGDCKSVQEKWQV